MKSLKAFIESKKEAPKPARPLKTVKEKMDEADVQGSKCLADANAALEAGHTATAEKFFARGQWWLDRYNKLAGNS